MGGCDMNGQLHEENFSAPMPWIGMYVLAATFVCLIAMAADVISGLRHHKLWFPCKLFSINATSLTLIGVAIKLAVDLNTPMPNRRDQLTKLSSSVLICTAMGNSMPSPGAMEDEEMFMNVIALGILVITLIVNICTQLATGAIFVFWKEHASIMFIMLVLLLMLVFSALSVPATKTYLENGYKKGHKLAKKDDTIQTRKDGSKLGETLTKFWVLAHTSSPQFVMGRSVTCTASGAFCLFGAMILAEAIVRAYLMPWSVQFCHGESDYKVTTTLILFTQAITVGVGTIAPAFRWFIAINFKCPKRGNISCRKEFEIEQYWIQGLVELQKCPLTFRIENRGWRKLAHEARNKLLDLCIAMQKGIVLLSKVIRFISILFVSRIFIFCDFIQLLKKKFGCENVVEPEKNPRKDLSCYVLYLEGEDALVDYMMNSNCDATEHWIQRGRKAEPKYLIQLLEKSTAEEGFRGVAEFDDDENVLPLDCEEPPNSWALPVVTLTSIALSLANIDNGLIEKLIRGVNEGLEYMIPIQKYLNGKGDLRNIRKAAEIVWLKVDLYHIWLIVDLKKLSLEGKSPKETLEQLSQTAKSVFEECKKKQMSKKVCIIDSPLKWSIKELAANSMYRISETLALNSEGGRFGGNHQRLFESIVVMISDIMGASLTNIQQAMATKCFNSSIEEREKSVRHAVYLLGKTEKIRDIVNKEVPSNLDPQQMACIDEWRLAYKPKMPLVACTSFLIPESDKASSSVGSSDHFYLTMDDYNPEEGSSQKM